MNRKYTVQKYSIMLLEIIIQLWDFDEYYFASFYFPTYLQWAYCYFKYAENIQSFFKRKTLDNPPVMTWVFHLFVLSETVWEILTHDLCNHKN